MRRRSTNQSGYSLVEAVIYTALVALLSVLLIGCLFIMYRSFKETRANRDLLDSAHTAMERMTREIHTAASVDSAASTLGTSPGVLRLNTTDSGGSAKTIQFGLSSGTIQMQDSGSYYGDLTTNKVSISSLVFTEITTTSGTAVRVELSMQALRSPSNKSISLSDTIALRGSY